jgi:hypothetical protein
MERSRPAFLDIVAYLLTGPIGDDPRMTDGRPAEEEA